MAGHMWDELTKGSPSLSDRNQSYSSVDLVPLYPPVYTHPGVSPVKFIADLEARCALPRVVSSYGVSYVCMFVCMDAEKRGVHVAYCR